MKDHRLAIGRAFLLATLLALLPAISALADQTQVRNYRTARVLFWGRVYPQGGYTFYCGEEFEDKTDLNVEHIYPASWMAAYLGCGTRKQCQKSSERFNRIEADLHNLYPARADINRARSNFRFGMIEGRNESLGSVTLNETGMAGLPNPAPSPVATSPGPFSTCTKSMACRLTHVI